MDRILFRNLKLDAAPSIETNKQVRPRPRRLTSTDDADAEVLKVRFGRGVGARRVTLQGATSSAARGLEASSQLQNRKRALSSASMSAQHIAEVDFDSSKDTGPVTPNALLPALDLAPSPPKPSLRRERAVSRASILSLASSGSSAFAPLYSLEATDERARDASAVMTPLLESVLVLSLAPDFAARKGKAAAPAPFYISPIHAASLNPTFQLDQAAFDFGALSGTRADTISVELWVRRERSEATSLASGYSSRARSPGLATPGS